MKQTFEEAAVKVAKFWSEKSFNAGLNQNNGDNGPSGSMTFGLLNMLSSSAQSKVTDDQIKTFEEALTNIIVTESIRTDYVNLGVDYGPCSELEKACEIAGVSTHCLPIKSQSWIVKKSDDYYEATGKFTYDGKQNKL